LRKAQHAGAPALSAADALRTIVEAREHGRRFVVNRPEKALTNWFPIQPPPRVRYYHFDGVQELRRERHGDREVVRCL